MCFRGLFMLVSILMYFTISFIPDVRFLLEVVQCFKFFMYFCCKFLYNIPVLMLNFASLQVRQSLLHFYFDCQRSLRYGCVVHRKTFQFYNWKFLYYRAKAKRRRRGRKERRVRLKLDRDPNPGPRDRPQPRRKKRIRMLKVYFNFLCSNLLAVWCNLFIIEAAALMHSLKKRRVHIKYFHWTRNMFPKITVQCTDDFLLLNNWLPWKA